MEPPCEQVVAALLTLGPEHPQAAFRVDDRRWAPQLASGGRHVIPGAEGALERLCRYVLRPPLARTRLHRRPDGLLVLTLRRPYADGTTEFIYSELELAEKLAALVPPARKNQISYHGVLAPRHGLRRQVVPQPPATASRGTLRKKPSKPRSRWHAWAGPGPA